MVDAGNAAADSDQDLDPRLYGEGLTRETKEKTTTIEIKQGDERAEEGRFHDFTPQTTRSSPEPGSS